MKRKNSNYLVTKLVKETIKEILNSRTNRSPVQVGFNNQKINSLVWWKNQKDPDRSPKMTWRSMFSTFDDDPVDLNPNPVNVTPKNRDDSNIYGSIGWPKDYIPPDFEAVNNLNSPLMEKKKNGMNESKLLNSLKNSKYKK